MSNPFKTVKPRFWLIVMVIFAISMSCVYASQADYMDRQAEALAELEVTRKQLAAENADLQRRIDFTYTDEYIIREAREKLGLVGENDILFESNDPAGGAR